MSDEGTKPEQGRENGPLIGPVLHVGSYLRGALPTNAERLLALEMVWAGLAKEARDEALFLPEGFSKEQDRQLEQLRRLVKSVIDDTPDIEEHRLILEGDIEGYRRHVYRKVTGHEPPPETAGDV